MNAYQTAQLLYMNNGYTRADLIHDIEWHSLNGYVVSTPCELALARPVSSLWSESIICDLGDTQLSKDELTLPLDCWHITCVVGNLKHLFEFLPFNLPYISYERNYKFHIHPLAKFL
jgi:hypothetical protein